MRCRARRSDWRARCSCGQDRVERGDGLRRELRKRDAVFAAALVGGEQRRSAAVGNDREPIAARNASHRQNARGGEELRIGLHADRAGARQRGVEHGVARSARVRDLQRAPGLQHDDRLGARRGAQRRQERARVAVILDVEQDAVGARHR